MVGIFVDLHSISLSVRTENMTLEYGLIVMYQDLCVCVCVCVLFTNRCDKDSSSRNKFPE